MSPWWFWVIALIASTAVSALLQRRVGRNDPQPSSIGEFSAPTAEEGRCIPVIFGTVRLRAPNVTAFGDLFTEAAHVDGALVNYRYFLSMQQALCHGTVDALIDIIVGEKSLAAHQFPASDGSIGPALPRLRPDGSLQTFSVNFPFLFGGDEKEGGIGFEARGGDILRFYFGAEDQTADTYLTTLFGGASAPAYRGLCHAVLQRTYLGTSNYIKPWHWVLKRIPRPLCLTTEVMDLDGDANPAEIILEILTNPIWGLGRPRARMDMASFASVAFTLASEGMGMSLILDNAQEAEQTIQDVLRHIDGVLYTDPATGLWTLKLARADYDPETLLELGPDEIIGAVEFSRGSWSETLNEIKIDYTSRADGYTRRTVQAQETANFAVQGERISDTIPFLGFTTAANAQRAAIRALKTFSVPLAKVRLKANRKAWPLRMGGVFKLNWEPLGFTGMVMRVIAINWGTLEDGEITIDAVEDIFAVAHTAYDAPSTPVWTDPVAPPAVPDAQMAIEAPYQIAGAASERILVGMTRGDSTTSGFRIYGDEGDGDGFLQRNIGRVLAPSGLLTANYSRTTDALDATGFTLEDGRDLESVTSTDTTGRDRGDNLLAFQDEEGGEITEICAFEDIADNGDGTFDVTGIVRGVYDTIPRDHAEGARVWIIRNERVRLLADYRADEDVPPESGGGGGGTMIGVVED